MPPVGDTLQLVFAGVFELEPRAPMSDFQAIADRVEIEALRGEFSDAVMMNDHRRLAPPRRNDEDRLVGRRKARQTPDRLPGGGHAR